MKLLSSDKQLDVLVLINASDLVNPTIAQKSNVSNDTIQSSNKHKLSYLQRKPNMSSVAIQARALLQTCSVSAEGKLAEL